MSFISLKGVTKEYKINNETFKALDDLSIEIEKGDFALILGPSGSGKSTALNIIGGMDKADFGSIEVDSIKLDKLKDKELSKYRRERVGFIFQSYNLISNLTVLENVMLSNKNVSEKEAREALSLMGILDKENIFPSSLSGGEAQRAAIARAIVKKPSILLCDEPTGALDSKNGKMVMECLKALSRDNMQTVVVVTHNPEYEEYATKLIRLKDGRLE